VDRRSFLGVAAAGAATVVIGACSSSRGMDLVVVPNDWDFFAGRPYRLSILLADNKASGAPVTIDAPLTLRVGPQHGPLGPAMRMAVHTDGPEPNYAVTTYTFPAPGWYTLQARFRGHTASTPVQVIAPAQSETPVVGAPMRSVPTPTVADHRGVNPYCTQTPPCPFHEVSLDVALARRQPVALQFATPALCQSKFCGPVLLNLEAVAGGWARRVTFIHCEIYTDLTGATSTRPVQVWGLQHEPMLYLGSADGVIVGRIDNLYDRAEARSALTAAFGPPAAG
jgi:hypothetical protein